MSLMLFNWIELLRFTDSLIIMRTWITGIHILLPAWIVYSLPFALWVCSYLFFIEYIWDKPMSISRNIWFWCLPIIALAVEISQSISILPGIYDSTDLLLLLVVIIIGIVLTFYNRIYDGVKNNESNT